MKVSVFGIGYVGCVSAACLAERRHHVLGVDSNVHKVKQLQRGTSPVLEPGLQEMVARSVQQGFLRATVDPEQAVMESDVSLICVGTPSRDNGRVDLTYVDTVCRQIASALRRKRSRHLIVLRSTVTPGTTEEMLIPTMEQISGKVVGRDLGICVNPEFMREGCSVKDFFHPPFTIIGEHSSEDGDCLRRLYRFLHAPVIRTQLKIAETVKLVSNSFHALKVGFANEVGNFCQSVGVDGYEVMNIFCQDRLLNISPSYLKPGFAFGGSCLPKDLQSLLYEAKRRDVETPLLRSILPSNHMQIQKALAMVKATGRTRVGIVGLSFKEGTDDLRQSPMVQLTELLIGKGYKVQIFDPQVRLARIFGSNRNYIQQEVPHIASLMTSSLGGLLRSAEVIILAQNNPAWRENLEKLRADQIVIDLVRVNDRARLNGSYRGICW